MFDKGNYEAVGSVGKEKVGSSQPLHCGCMPLVQCHHHPPVQPLVAVKLASWQEGVDFVMKAEGHIPPTLGPSLLFCWRQVPECIWVSAGLQGNSSSCVCVA